MNRFIFPATCLIALFAQTQSGQAITAVTRDFDQLVARADTVFKGTVTASASRWIGAENTRRIVTFVTFQVTETYKGEPAATETLRFLGGTVGEDTMTVPDMPQFEIGQDAVLFVVGNGRQYCPLVGVSQGRFHVLKETNTGRERIFTDDFSPVVTTAEIGKLDETGTPVLKRRARAAGANTPKAIAADDFRAEILGKVAALAH